MDGRYFYEDNNNRIFTDDVHFYNEDGYKIILDNIINLIENKKINPTYDTSIAVRTIIRPNQEFKYEKNNMLNFFNSSKIITS